MTQAGPTGADAPTGRAARELLEDADRLVTTARAVLDDHARAVDSARTALAPSSTASSAGSWPPSPSPGSGTSPRAGCGSARWNRPVT